MRAREKEEIVVGLKPKGHKSPQLNPKAKAEQNLSLKDRILLRCDSDRCGHGLTHGAAYAAIPPCHGVASWCESQSTPHIELLCSPQVVRHCWQFMPL